MCALTREEVCTVAQDLKIEVNDAAVIHFSAVSLVLGGLRLLRGISTSPSIQAGGGHEIAALIWNKRWSRLPFAARRTHRYLGICVPKGAGGGGGGGGATIRPM